MAKGPHVLIVGAGIIGVMIARQLLQKGAEVTLVDAGGNAASAASFGWINASFFLDPHHFALRQEAMAAYERLLRACDIPVRRCGALSWEFDTAGLTAQAEALRSMGYRVQDIDGMRFRELVPNLGAYPDTALFFPDELAAESGAVTRHLTQLAQEGGARLVRGARVIRPLVDKGTVVGVHTDAGTLAADHVVIAAGTGAFAIAEAFGRKIPSARRPALMLRTRPVPLELKPILVTPVGEVRQLPDGGLLMPAAVGHQGASDTELAGSLDDASTDALARLQALFPTVPMEIAESIVAMRPYPMDGFPVVGSIGSGVSLAVMHSGITLGAFMGELLATEILRGPTNETSRWLAPYRPDRFEA